MSNDPFNKPFASPIQVPGGIGAQIAFGYFLNRAGVAGLIDDPLYTGGHNAFDVFRGTRYDQRQMTALQAAADAQRAQLQVIPEGLVNLAGREYSTELQRAASNIFDKGMPFAMEMMRQSPSARRVVSAASGGTSAALVGLGMEGITRRMLDPGTGMVGMSGTQSTAMAESVTNMLSAGPRFTTRRDGGRGVMLNQGSNYGFSEIDTMFAMATMAREGSLPSTSNFLADIANPGLQAAFKDKTLDREAYALGGKLTRQQQMMIDDGEARASDFYDSTRTGVLSIMDEFGVTDAKSFEKFQNALSDEKSPESARLQQINASRFAEAAGARIATLQAVTEFLTADEVKNLGEDLADVSSAMLKQMSGNASHQLSAAQLERNLRDMKFASDRLGLSREQVQAVAGMSAAAASQYGFEAVDTDSFARSALTSMQQYNDMGVGNFASAGIDMYGADSKEEMVTRNQRGRAGVRRSRNANMLAALSILSRQAGVELTKGGVADRMLKEIEAGQLTEESIAILGGTNESIAAAFTGSATGITSDDIYSKMGMTFVMQAEMDRNKNIVTASEKVAHADVFRNNLAVPMQRELARSLDGIGTAEHRGKLAAVLSGRLAEDLRKQNPENLKNNDADGSLITSQLAISEAVLAEQAAAGNTAAQALLAMSPEEREDQIRNAMSNSYDAVVNKAENSLASIVANSGSLGQEKKTTAEAYSAAMGDLDKFAQSGNMTGAARTIAILKGATETGGSLADFLSVVGLDGKGQTAENLGNLGKIATREIATLDKQIAEMGGVDALGKNHPLLEKRKQYQSTVDKIKEFQASGGKGIVSDEYEKKVKDYLEEHKDSLMGTGTGEKTAEKTAEKTSEEIAARIEELETGIAKREGFLATMGLPGFNGIVSAEDRTTIEQNIAVGREELERLRGGDTSGGVSGGAGDGTKISTATIDNVSMGPVTITLGNTVIQSDSATVASNRGSRSDVAGTA